MRLQQLIDLRDNIIQQALKHGIDVYNYKHGDGSFGDYVDGTYKQLSDYKHILESFDVS